MKNFIAIIILIMLIIASYIFLFWFFIGTHDENYFKEIQFSKLLEDFFIFILYSGFILAPSIIIFQCVIKLLKIIYS